MYVPVQSQFPGSPARGSHFNGFVALMEGPRSVLSMYHVKMVTSVVAIVRTVLGGRAKVGT